MRPSRLWALLLATVALPAAAEPILLENARVFDGQRDRGITPVLIDGARIVHIGTPLPAAATGARRIDYTGKTLLPALVSDHAHVGKTPRDWSTATATTRATTWCATCASSSATASPPSPRWA